MFRFSRDPAPAERPGRNHHPSLLRRPLPWRPALLGAVLLLGVTACAQPGTDRTGDPLDRQREAFEQRAAEVAEAWRIAAAGQDTWRTGYVPLQGPTVLPADPHFTDETWQAFTAGWYRAQIDPPDKEPADAVIRFPDGELTVPVISAAEAYRQLDQGDPPACPRRSASPTGTGPDGSVASPVTACIPLTVTGVTFDTVTVRTSRGTAEVPAWLFAIDELAAPVARLAVAPAVIAPVPDSSPPPQPSVPEYATAMDLTGVDGARLHYRVGIGACDRDAEPLVREEADVVIVSAAVTRGTGVCTDQLLVTPVTATLDEPMGDRPVLDAVTGKLLLLVPTR